MKGRRPLPRPTRTSSPSPPSARNESGRRRHREDTGATWGCAPPMGSPARATRGGARRFPPTRTQRPRMTMFELHRHPADEESGEDARIPLEELLEPYGTFEQLPAGWPRDAGHGTADE